MNIVEEIRQDINAVELASDWLGDTGTPVHQMVADFRAYRCIHGNQGEMCPLNVEPDWWNRVRAKIAEWIKGQIELKNKMHLKAAQEDMLGMCKACGCALPTKVWVPTIHLKRHTPKEVIKKTPDYCWLRKELDHELF